MNLKFHGLLMLSLPIALSGCDGGPTAPHPAPAKTEAIAHESDLLKLTLTSEAQVRLGIRTVRAGQANSDKLREVGGEIVVPALGAAGVPTGSAANLTQIGAQQATADGELERTRAVARLATIAYDRADALVREEAGSIRARDEAAAALATARAAANAAQAQRRLLGPPVAAMNDQSTLWVRAALSGSDLATVARGRAASVRPLGGGNAAGRSARPIQAPPSANPLAGTTDLYFTLDNRDHMWRVGQRVTVALPIGGAAKGLSIPAAAIVRDIYGGEWVYRKTAPDSYVRQRIEVMAVQGSTAILARGLEPDAEVVTDGAAELFGAEFGTPH